MPWSMLNTNGQRKYLTRDETNRFLQSAILTSPSVYAFCWVIASTGCRISEALAIGLDNIDFESRHIVFETLKKRQKGIFRTVPLSEELLRKLTGWIADGTLARQGRFWPWSRMTAYRRITEVMQQAGVKGAWGTPKGLRHAFGVRAVHSGVPLNLVQRWLGHADMKTTSIYASAIGPEEREIASKAWLDSDQKKPQRPKRATSTGTQNTITSSSDAGQYIVNYLSTARPAGVKHVKGANQPVGREAIIEACGLIQFWLEGNSDSDGLSLS